MSNIEPLVNAHTMHKVATSKAGDHLQVVLDNIHTRARDGKCKIQLVFPDDLHVEIRKVILDELRERDFNVLPLGRNNDKSRVYLVSWGKT